MADDDLFQRLPKFVRFPILGLLPFVVIGVPIGILYLIATYLSGKVIAWLIALVIAYVILYVTGHSMEQGN
jgi:putative flippase GtrA